MLEEQLDQIKKQVSCVESDSIAEIRTGENAVGRFPVYFNAATGEPYVRIYGKWHAASDLKTYDPHNPRSTGIVRYETLKPLTRKFLDTATLEIVEVPR